jgi:sec-independent protein translocase protein TatC
MPRRIAPRRLGPEEEATLVEHLSELRHRLLLGLAAFVPAFLLAFAFHSRLIKWLEAPLPPDRDLVTLGVTEPFTTAVKVSLLAAIAIAGPILIWQVWAFLAPATSRATQRVLSVFVVVATALFATGVVFAYYVVLPAALKFLTNFDDDLYSIQIRASYYLSFTSMMLLASGLAFEMPIFILALVRIGVLSSAKLRKNRRIGIVLMVCFAILLPTVDPVSLLFETVPLLILFESSIWLSVLMERRWAGASLTGEDDTGEDEPNLDPDAELYDEAELDLDPDADLYEDAELDFDTEGAGLYDETEPDLDPDAALYDESALEDEPELEDGTDDTAAEDDAGDDTEPDEK